MPDAIVHLSDSIIGQSLIDAESIAQKLRKRLATRLTSRRMTDAEIIRMSREILHEFEPLLAENLASSDIAAWIAGADSINSRITLDTVIRETTPLPSAFPKIEQAARSLEERAIVSRSEFDQLSRDAHRRAFAVAGEQSEDAIATIRDVLAENIREGTSLRGFRQKIEKSLEGSFIGPAHLETVYRTNTQASFHDGHERILSDPVVGQMFPYQEYLAFHDDRTRDNHRLLETSGIDGTNIYRRSDPFWDIFTPPWGYRCRCGVNALTLEQAARRLREAALWLESGTEPPMVSRLEFIPFRPERLFA